MALNRERRDDRVFIPNGYTALHASRGVSVGPGLLGIFKSKQSTGGPIALAPRSAKLNGSVSAYLHVTQS